MNDLMYRLRHPIGLYAADFNPDFHSPLWFDLLWQRLVRSRLVPESIKILQKGYVTNNDEVT